MDEKLSDLVLKLRERLQFFYKGNGPMPKAGKESASHSPFGCIR
jgi:hypothetical protein